MKEISSVKSNHGFALINGKLIECDVTMLDWCMVEGVSETWLHVTYGDKTEKISPSQFFESVEDFRNNVQMPLTRNVWLPGRLYNVNFSDPDFTWVIEDGRVKQKFLDIQTITIRFGENGRVESIESPDIPDVCYKLKDIAQSFLDIEVLNADGTEKKIIGAANLVTLTDEQRKIVEDMLSIAKKANDMGVRFVADWNGVYAFNSNNVKDWNVEYDEYDGMERVDVQSEYFAIGMNLCVSSDDNMLNIKRID